MGLIAHNARWTNYRSTHDARSSAILSPEQACLGIPRLGNFLAMRKVNTNAMPEESWCSPKGKFCGFGKQVSEALGRKPQSFDLRERHPFDVEICRIPAVKS